MKIKLIQPTKYLESGKLLKVKPRLFPSPTLPLIAALTPDDVEVGIQEESFEEIDFDEKVDLVGITGYTIHALRAYEIADEFRRRNVHVVMGGIHVSMEPDEAAEHADTVIVGEAEETWPQFIHDFRNGTPRKRYVAERLPSLADLPVPRYSLLDPSHYTHFGKKTGLFRLLPGPMFPIQSARGCPHDCEFCAVTAFNGRKYRVRPVSDVVNELKALRARSCLFIDDNIFARPQHAKELFRALRPLRIQWLGQATIGAAKDAELLQLARESGCAGVCVGLESLSPESIQAMGKTENVVEDYEKHLRTHRDIGIPVMVSMMFGFGPEDPQVFEQACDFLIRNRVPYTVWWPVTPFPGTRLLARLRREGRLKHDKWWLKPASAPKALDLKHTGVVMGEDVFYENWSRAYARFYSLGSVLRRLLFPPRRHWMRNMLFNLASRKLLREEPCVYVFWRPAE